MEFFKYFLLLSNHWTLLLYCMLDEFAGNVMKLCTFQFATKLLWLILSKIPNLFSPAEVIVPQTNVCWYEFVVPAE